MRRVLVTGATGFIGRHTLSPLLERGYEVHALYFDKPLKADERITWHQANLLESEGARKICAEVRPTHLLHLAWYVNPKDYKTSPENDRWRAATSRLLEAFQENGGKRTAIAGSTMEYDPSLTDEFIKEDAPTADHNAYAAAKNRTHEEAEEFARENGISLSWGRIFNLYGPCEARERLVSQVILSLLAQKPPNIPTGGLILDYSYVKDIAGAFAALLDTDVAGTINIASGNPISLRQIAFIVAELLGKPQLVQDVNDFKPSTGPARVVADIQRLKDEVKWAPGFSLEAGLRETIEWWKQNL